MTVRDKVWPQVGDVWADEDPRMKGRTLKVVAVGRNTVEAEVLTDREGIVRPTVGKAFVIAIARMVDGQYRRLSVPDGGPGPS